MAGIVDRVRRIEQEGFFAAAVGTAPATAATPRARADAWGYEACVSLVPSPEVAVGD